MTGKGTHRGEREREQERYIKRSDQKIFAQTIFFIIQNENSQKVINKTQLYRSQMGYIHYMDTLNIVYSIY